MGEDDRRKYQRKKKQSVISFYLIREDGGKKTQQGVVMDGSPAGVRFRSETSIAKNTRIYIKLDSEEWGEELTYFCKEKNMELTEVIGSVMWCLESEIIPGEYEVGTRFIGEVEH
jgi:hypothetical protein